MIMKKYSFMATRQLTGFSGSDMYINLSSNQDIDELFELIKKSDIYEVNKFSTTCEKNIRSNFVIYDPYLKKTFDVHIRDQKAKDGLWFRLTNYVKYQKIIPGQILSLDTEINSKEATVQLYSLDYFKYVLQKHNKHQYVLMSETPASKGNNKEAEYFLKHYGFIKTDIVVSKWCGKFVCYQVLKYSKKYIGIPYIKTLPCCEFDNIGEII